MDKSEGRGNNMCEKPYGTPTAQFSDKPGLAAVSFKKSVAQSALDDRTQRRV
jgi:hypothetical protein